MITTPAGFYSTSVGAITVTALHDGFVSRDRPEGFVADIAPEKVERAFVAAGLGAGRLTLSFTAFAVESAGKLALIDAGFGENGPPTAGRIGANLKAAGHDCDAVDLVLLSHFHGDHIAGLITKDGALVYGNAEVLVPQGEWDFWMGDARMEAAPEAAKGNFELCRKVFGALGDRVRCFAPGDEVLDGVHAVSMPGHSPGMSGFDIRSQGERLLFVADVTNTPTVFAPHPEWITAFDMDGAATVATRRQVFDSAAAEATRLAFYHGPFPALGRVASTSDGYVYLPEPWGADLDAG